MMDGHAHAEKPPHIVLTERDYLFERWMYLLSDGAVVLGNAGDARIPAGLPFTERMQWGANRIFGRG